MRYLFILIVLFPFFLGCKNEGRVYFFKYEFYTTPAIKCDEIKTTSGVLMLKVKDTDFTLKCISAFKRYSNLISSYSSDYRIRIESDEHIICSNLELLLDLKNEVSESDYALFLRLKKLLSDKEKDAIQIVPPLPVPGEPN